MGQVIQVNGDYNIKTKPTGTITLDTGDRSGKVIVTGNLEVKGHVLTVASENLTITDNIIVLNNGETGAGVTLVDSGLLIDRGTLVPAGLLYHEPTDSWNFVHGYDDSTRLYSFENSNIKVKSILTDSSTDSGDLTLIATGTGVIKVNGTTDYEKQILDYTIKSGVPTLGVLTIDTISRTGDLATVKTVENHGISANELVDVFCTASTFNGNDVTVLSTTLDTITYRTASSDYQSTISVSGFVRKNQVKSDDNIPNMRAVADYTKSIVSTTLEFLNVSFSDIRDYDTAVSVSDHSTTGNPSTIVFKVDSSISEDGGLRAFIDNSGLTVDKINVFGNTISSSTNAIKLDSVLTIKNVTTNPAVESGHVSLYSKNANDQTGTGLHFVNTTGTTGELVSKSTAFLYSLIF